jgi:hypothetical protein
MQERAVQERAINERVASLEKDNELCEKDRRDLWAAINELRPLPERFDSLAATAERIELLCEKQDGRVTALQTAEIVSKTQRNIAIGLAGFIAAGVGGVAMWIVTNVGWPALKKALSIG